ncbi:MAG: NAD-dependent malic enzyme [Candidatus Micrarchaeota archaeon]|nr:MAG: NAD-dependent malic enzyme [Candidatus Micrarchaeota archaeon]
MNDPIEFHKLRNGKIQVMPKVKLKDKNDLKLAYTPGVADVSLAIKADKNLSFEYTNRSNSIAIVTDGTRILGLGKIGPEAGMPVMEGKALLFKHFGGVDAIPLAISNTDKGFILSFIRAIAPSFGGINLEDIESPKVVEILKELESSLEIPVFHDDSYGTAVSVLAALINALKLVGKSIKEIKIVVNGAGSAGYGIVKLLVSFGAKDIIVFDTKGAIFKDRDQEVKTNIIKREISEITNKDQLSLSIEEAVKGADLLIGVSTKGAFNKEMIKKMNDKAIVFALANPIPEIDEQSALDAGAYIYASGRSDQKNQVNNLLAFPGIMRGLLDVNAIRVNDNALIAAADAIASSLKGDLDRFNIIPDIFSQRSELALNVAYAVGRSLIKDGLARRRLSDEDLKAKIADKLKLSFDIEDYILDKL